MVLIREAPEAVAASEALPAAAPPEARWTVRRRRHLAIGLGFLLALVPLLAMLTEGTFDPGFRASHDAQSHFYDAQARSILQGRLDVPIDAIGGEGIHVDGGVYGYFGITPALLRLPFMAVVSPDGYPNWAPWSYLAAFVVQGLMAVGIWRAVQRRFALTAPPVLDGVVVFASLAASPTVLLTARPDVYEEAILWGITFTLVTFWALLRLFEHPQRSWVGVAVAGAALSLLARPPVGMASLLAVGAAAVVLFVRDRASWPLCVRLIAGSGAAVAVYLGVNLLKFGTLVDPPYQYHEVFMTQPRRLASLLKYGTNSPRNVPTNVLQYLRPDTLHLGGSFPWVTFRMPHHAPVFEIGAVHFDGFEFPVSVTAIAPALFVFAVIGTVVVARRRSVDLAVPVGAGLVAILATCTFFGESLRYLGDFVPWLVVAGCIGLAAACTWEPRRTWVKPALVVTAGVAILWSLYVSLSLARVFQSVTIG